MEAIAMNKDTLSLQDLTDSGLRRALFTDMSKALSGEIARGVCEDGPSSIAKLMERAFQTGVAMRGTPDLSEPKNDVRRSLTEADLPPSLRKQLYKFRLLLGFGLDGSIRRDPTVRGMVLVMLPRHPGYSNETRRDEWFSPILKNSVPFSLNAINQLVGLGLYERPQELNGGWLVTIMTEWGFEFLTTGKTCDLKDRTPGSSGTYEAFRSLMGDVTRSELSQRTATEMGYVAEEEAEASVRAFDESLAAGIPQASHGSRRP